MQKHWVVAFSARTGFNESRTAALDLNAAAGLLLNVFHVRTALPDNLRAQIKPRDWLEINRNAFLGPFALYNVSEILSIHRKTASYAAKLVPFYRIALARAEPPFVDQIWELLLHEVVDESNGLLKAVLAGARHMQIQRRVLSGSD